jgi:hypothetical protein
MSRGGACSARREENMTEYPTRQQLEKNLIEKTKALIHVRRVLKEAQSEHNWFETEEFYDYIDAWLELRLYYRGSEDAIIGALTLNSYWTFTNFLREELVDCATSQQPNEELEEASRNLEGIVEELLRYAVSNYYRQEES